MNHYPLVVKLQLLSRFAIREATSDEVVVSTKKRYVELGNKEILIVAWVTDLSLWAVMRIP